MIHKIIALHDNGQDFSVRAISKQLSIYRNTVRKYLRLSEAAIKGQQSVPSSTKKLDDLQPSALLVRRTRSGKVALPNATQNWLSSPSVGGETHALKP